MKISSDSFDVIVCGGGMAGFCAALASARHGAKTCLIQDRPVLGGNASSEVRVTIHGAACHHDHARETGIIGEAMNAERRANHIFPIENGWTNSVHDMTLYDLAIRESNLTLHLNTTVKDVQMDDGTWGLEQLPNWPIGDDAKGYLHRPACHQGKKVKAIKAEVANAEVQLILETNILIDCTGDALPAHLAGCEWRWGSESTEETGEIHAPAKSSTDTMGNSIHIRCIDTGRPAPFKAPDWAVKHDDPSYFYDQGRAPNEPQGGYWWIEIGVPWNTIYDNETIRHELTRHALGVWDWMKNKDPKTIDKCRNFALEFIGQVPGKRESRRVIGHHFINENELQARTDFPDVCAYGGWFIDLHTPGGLLADSSEPASALGYNPHIKEIALKYIGPYGLPLRAMISKDVPNLLMAGRNISTTHAALGTVRVMATCGLMGQAVGTLAAFSTHQGKDPVALTDPEEVKSIQQALLRDGCFLPHRANQDSSDLARTAEAEASSSFALSGLGAWESAEDTCIRDWVWQGAKGKTTPLSRTPCQWFYGDGGALEKIGVHLFNTTEQTRTAQLRLVKVDSIWAYAREEGELLWEGEVDVTARQDEMVWAFPALIHLPEGCLRLEVDGPETVEIRHSTNYSYGLCGGLIIGSGKFHKGRSLAFQVFPHQSVYRPKNALTGITRPQNQTNLWLSDPAQSLPQHLALNWSQPVTFSQVELTFPPQLVVETHWENPFYVAPHIARRYRIQIRSGNTWETIHTETDNQESRRQHQLPAPVTTDHLRVLIEETHGSRSAGLTEIRVY